MVASDLQDVSMDLIYRVILNVFVFCYPLIFYFSVEIIDVLGNDTDLFTSSPQVFNHLREKNMSFVRLCFHFELIKVL